MRTRLAALAALLTLALAAAPVSAVTRGGVPDNGEHPMVGQLLFYVPDVPNGIYEDNGGWFTCTGTLVSSTVVLTAGHCTFGVGDDGSSTTNDGEATNAADGGVGGTDIWINFAEDGSQWDGWPLTFDEDGNLNYPTEHDRYLAREAWADANWIRGTAYPHDNYNDLAFYLYDLGVVVLDEAQSGTYAKVAPQNYLQRYAKSRAGHYFEVVGYGLNKVLAGGKLAFGGDTRMKAEPKLNNLVSNPKNTYIQLSNNPHTGGTCFGDSGGPTFDNTNSLLVVGVTSFGLSPNCTGIGGAYRVDQPDDLAFLADFGITP
jgi:V8-like Glu-specific endopeptidase